MPEQIISGSGTQYGMIVNADGSINSSITGSITIGSISAYVDSVYIQSGANMQIDSVDNSYLTSGNITNIVSVSGPVISDDLGSAFWVKEKPEIGSYSLQNVQVYSGTHGPIGVNDSTDALTVSQFANNKINDGDHYQVEGWTTIPVSGGSISFYMIAPNNTKWTNLTFDVNANNLIEWSSYEYFVGNGGTRIIPNNNNRNSDKLYTGSIFLDPDTTQAGSLTTTGFFGAAGQNPQQQGITGAGGRDSKLILKSGTGYLWVFKAGGADTKIGWDAEIYEHEDSITQF